MAERACWGIGPFARRVKEEATHGRTKAFGRFVRTAPRGAAVFHEVSMHRYRKSPKLLEGSLQGKDRSALARGLLLGVGCRTSSGIDA